MGIVSSLAAAWLDSDRPPAVPTPSASFSGHPSCAESVRELCLTGHLVLKSSRSARFSPEDEHGSRATVTGFAICISEQFKRATVRVRTPLRARGRLESLNNRHLYS